MDCIFLFEIFPAKAKSSFTHSSSPSLTYVQHLGALVCFYEIQIILVVQPSLRKLIYSLNKGGAFMENPLAASLVSARLLFTLMLLALNQPSRT